MFNEKVVQKTLWNISQHKVYDSCRGQQVVGSILIDGMSIEMSEIWIQLKQRNIRYLNIEFIKFNSTFPR